MIYNMETIPEQVEATPVQPTASKVSKKKTPKKTHVIPRVCLARLVREITQKYADKYIWSSEAMNAVQESLEAYIEQRFRVCNNMAKICKKSTINKEIFDFFDTYLNNKMESS